MLYTLTFGVEQKSTNRRHVSSMETYDSAWVDAQVEYTVGTWLESAATAPQQLREYSPEEQTQNERAYDEALTAVEGDLQSAAQAELEQSALQHRIVGSFARFSAKALDLNSEAIDLLTHEFLPAGTQLARWARRFDPALSMSDIIQAARNAWTACGLQPLLGARVQLTPAILGYSLLYPYSDNYLDDQHITPAAKLEFSRRFRRCLAGEVMPAASDRERAMWALIALIESQYPRQHFPQVFDCLLAIHHAQEQSISQLHVVEPYDSIGSLRLSCAKGGTSVLADACLAHGSLNEQESRFSFQWGVLLQIGDDLQDVHDDLRRGSLTLFSRAAGSGTRLDSLTVQLLNFSEKVGARMADLPSGTPMLKNLLEMSWRSLIIRAVADSHEFFSADFLEQAERASPFRFDFLRDRNARLAGCQGLYAGFFNALVESPENPLAHCVPQVEHSQQSPVTDIWSGREL